MKLFLIAYGKISDGKYFSEKKEEEEENERREKYLITKCTETHAHINGQILKQHTNIHN